MTSSDTSPPPTSIAGMLHGDVSKFSLVSGDSEAFASRHGDLEFALDLVQAAVVPEGQERARQDIVRFCGEHPDALFRSCLEGHLTASVFVVEPVDGAVALIHHRKLDRWLQPGGHADGEGNLALVAATELAEEVGLDDQTFVTPVFDIDIHAIPARGDVPRHLHLDLRFLALAGSTDLRPNEETLGAAWVSDNDSRFDPTSDVAMAVRRAIDLAQQLTGT